jgi:hypothetical protein
MTTCRERLTEARSARRSHAAVCIVDHAPMLVPTLRALIVMTSWTLAVVAFAALGGAAAAAQSQSGMVTTPAPMSMTGDLSLTGCAFGGGSTRTLASADSRRPHHKGTTSFRVFEQNVQVAGRLVPSTNVAGQAGALNPVFVSIALAERGAVGAGYDRPPRPVNRRVASTPGASSPLGCPAP